MMKLEVVSVILIISNQFLAVHIFTTTEEICKSKT